MLKLHASIDKILSYTANAKILYEEECYIHDSSHILSFLKIGAYSYIGQGALIGAASIGRFCSIGPDVKIGLGEHDISLFSTHPIFYGSKHGYSIPDRIGTPRNIDPDKNMVYISDDVWIGAGAVLRKGIKIAKGAVIGANAVVTKDVGPYEVWGGVPAKLIKYRFEKHLIVELNSLDWTKLDLSLFCDRSAFEIEKLIKYLKFANADKNNFASYKIGFVEKNKGQFKVGRI